MAATFQQNRDSALHDNEETDAIAKHAEMVLGPLRQKLDKIDDDILELFAQRYALRETFIKVKSQHDIPVIVPKRMHEVLDRVTAKAHKLGIDPHFARELYETVIRYSHRFEYDQRDGKRRAND